MCYYLCQNYTHEQFQESNCTESFVTIFSNNSYLSLPLFPLHPIHLSQAIILVFIWYLALYLEVYRTHWFSVSCSIYCLPTMDESVCSSLFPLCVRKRHTHLATPSLPQRCINIFFWLGQLSGFRGLWLSMLHRDASCSKLYDIQCPS